VASWAARAGPRDERRRSVDDGLEQLRRVARRFEQSLEQAAAKDSENLAQSREGRGDAPSQRARRFERAPDGADQSVPRRGHARPQVGPQLARHVGRSGHEPIHQGLRALHGSGHRRPNAPGRASQRPHRGIDAIPHHPLEPGEDVDHPAPRVGDDPCDEVDDRGSHVADRPDDCASRGSDAAPPAGRPAFALGLRRLGFVHVGLGLVVGFGDRLAGLGPAGARLLLDPGLVQADRCGALTRPSAVQLAYLQVGLRAGRLLAASRVGVDAGQAVAGLQPDRAGFGRFHPIGSLGRAEGHAGVARDDVSHVQIQHRPRLGVPLQREPGAREPRCFRQSDCGKLAGPAG
jgi:hypothetical protein